MLFPGNTQALAGGGALTCGLDPTLAYATDLLSNLASETPSPFLTLIQHLAKKRRRKIPTCPHSSAWGFLGAQPRERIRKVGKP